MPRTVIFINPIQIIPKLTPATIPNTATGDSAIAVIVEVTLGFGNSAAVSCIVVDVIPGVGTSLIAVLRKSGNARNIPIFQINVPTRRKHAE